MIDFSALCLKLPTSEQLAEQARERIRQQAGALAAPGAFLAISLSDWLSHGVHGVGFVPAREVARLDRSVWERFERDDPPVTAAIERFQSALESAMQEQGAGGSMLRWDFCSSIDLKAALADGVDMASPVFRQACASLPLDDPRAIDILFEYPRPAIPALLRPWVSARMVDGFPLEFRAFVRGNELQGIASYYPQRALPENDEIRAVVDQVRRAATNMVAGMLAAGAYPWMLGYEQAFERGSVNASIDFVVDEQGQVLFLEAGPAAGFGAHPCAFLAREIEGVALSLGDGVQLR